MRTKLYRIFFSGLGGFRFLSIGIFCQVENDIFEKKGLLSHFLSYETKCVFFKSYIRIRESLNISKQTCMYSVYFLTARVSSQSKTPTRYLY